MVGFNKASLVELRLDLTPNLVGYRRFRFPISKDLIECFALLILGNGGRYVRTDLSLASNPLDAVDQFIRQADRDAFHTIIILVKLLQCSGDYPNVGAVCPHVA
jgi:hypothetical protein